MLKSVIYPSKATQRASDWIGHVGLQGEKAGAKNGFSGVNA